MDDGPSAEGLALQLLVSVAVSSVVCLVFVYLKQPVAYVALGLTVALVLLAKRLRRPALDGVPRWAPLAVLPFDTLLWPTAVVADVLASLEPADHD
ncbi:MAG: hypothetical protein JW751_23795 [Polyangiaceae bacterium]|nr:hypothetical protein [Polyangiaceae bacterium]